MSKWQNLPLEKHQLQNYRHTEKVKLFFLKNDISVQQYNLVRIQIIKFITFISMWLSQDISGGSRCHLIRTLDCNISLTTNNLQMTTILRDFLNRYSFRCLSRLNRIRHCKLIKYIAVRTHSPRIQQEVQKKSKSHSSRLFEKCSCFCQQQISQMFA